MPRRRRRRYNPRPTAPHLRLDWRVLFMWLVLALAAHGIVVLVASKYTKPPQEKVKEEEIIVIADDPLPEALEVESNPLPEEAKETEDPETEDLTDKEVEPEEVAPEEAEEDQAPEEAASPSEETTEPDDGEPEYADANDLRGGGLDAGALGSNNGGLGVAVGRSARGPIRRGGSASRKPRGPRRRKPPKVGNGGGGKEPQIIPEATGRRNLSAKARPNTRYNRRFEAVYPPARLAAKVEVELVVMLRVRADGTVAQVKIIKSGGADFDAAAIKAFKKHKYEPARGRDGQPVASDVGPVTYRFRIDERT